MKIVKEYLPQLETALFDPNTAVFRTLLTKLDQDERVSDRAMKSLAKRFSGYKKARDRAHALKQIASRHDCLVTRQLKALATGDRVAS